MNKLSRDDRARILHLLCEGSSIRAVTRLTGASKNTVSKLMIEAGHACLAYHDKHVRGLKSERVQVDEIWTFTYAKQKNVANAKAAPEGAGGHLDVDRSRCRHEAYDFVACRSAHERLRCDVSRRSPRPSR